MYIDPGTGSLILQIVAAGIIAVSASATRVRTYVARLFQRNREG